MRTKLAATFVTTLSVLGLASALGAMAAPKTHHAAAAKAAPAPEAAAPAPPPPPPPPLPPETPEQARAEIIALARNAMAAVNKGDLNTVRDLMPAESIMDEVPPFAWLGRDATGDWLVSVDADNRKLNETDAVSELGAPTYIRVEDDHAYAVFPERFRYKRAGKPVRENGTWTFQASRNSDGWRITAWTYSASSH